MGPIRWWRWRWEQIRIWPQLAASDKTKVVSQISRVHSERGIYWCLWCMMETCVSHTEHFCMQISLRVDFLPPKCCYIPVKHSKLKSHDGIRTTLGLQMMKYWELKWKLCFICISTGTLECFFHTSYLLNVWDMHTRLSIGSVVYLADLEHFGWFRALLKGPRGMRPLC